MPQKEFILQGFTARTHADVVREIFDLPKIRRVILSIAFVTAGGVDLLEHVLAGHASKITVFAGIRNELTTGQGLTALHRAGLKLYTVDTGSRRIIFHPKLYLVRSTSEARLVVGSANLTRGGMNNNIEASMLLNFDLADAHDKAVVDSIEARFSALPTEYPDHVVRITTPKQIDELAASGRVIDEMAIPPPHPSSTSQSGGADTVVRIKLKVPPLPRKALVGAPPAKKSSARPSKVVEAEPDAVAPGSAPATTGLDYEPVWESKPLTRRDLSIPTAANTHATGSINLDKGLLEEAIDHRHYFREDVFDGLSWAPTKSGTTEEAYAKFQLVLKGISYGEFDLRIGHSTDTTSKMYQQRNAMTRLSLGPMRTHIAHEALIGRTMRLYRDKANPTCFVLEID